MIQALIAIQLFIHLWACLAFGVAALRRGSSDYGVQLVFFATLIVGLRRVGAVAAPSAPELAESIDLIVPFVTSVLLFAAGLAFVVQTPDAEVEDGRE